MTQRPEFPADLRVEELGRHLTVTRNWRRGRGGPLLVFGLLWMAVVVFIIFRMKDEGEPSSFWFVPTFFGLIGIGLLVAGLASLVNRTTWEVDNERLRERHGPLPVRRGWVIERDDIARVEAITGPTAAEAPWLARRVAHRARVRAGLSHIVIEMKDGTKRPLITQLDSFEQAKYLEEAFDRALRLRDTAG